MNPNKRLLIIVALGIIACYLVVLLPEEAMEPFVEEDGIYESLTAVGFFITSIGFVIAFFRSGSEENKSSHPILKRLSYLALAMIFLFGAGEEISWGQRIINLETPEAWREINAQEEINLHNLNIFHDDEYDLFNTDRLFALFWGTLMVGIPVLAFASPKIKAWLDVLVPIFPWSLGLLFIVNYLMAKVAKSYLLAIGAFPNDGGSLDQSVVEIKEGVYAFLFVIVVGYLLRVMLRTTNRELNSKPALS